MRRLKPQNKTIGKNLETISSAYSDDTIINLAFKYLRLVYPVLRLNLNGKFKRAIILDGITYSVSSDKNKFIPIIISDLASTFNLSQIDTRELIFDYFKIKKLI